MSGLRLFEYQKLDPDCFLSGSIDKPDSPVETFMCWKQLAGVALAQEFIVSDVPGQGYRFRFIPQTIHLG